MNIGNRSVHEIHNNCLIVLAQGYDPWLVDTNSRKNIRRHGSVPAHKATYFWSTITAEPIAYALLCIWAHYHGNTVSSK